MESRHSCEQFAAKLDEARSVSLSMSLQEQVEAMKLLFTFLEHLQKDIIERLSEKSYDIVCNKITTSSFIDKACSIMCFHRCTSDKVSVKRGLRNKILAGGSTTLPRRQTARKTGPRGKLDNLSQFLQQRACLNQVVAASSATPVVATNYSPSLLGNQLVFHNTESPSVCDSRDASPLSLIKNACMPDGSTSVSLTRKRHQRREKVNGRYYCNFPQCSDSYLNLEHIVDHENQHGFPDGKYLACSFSGCKDRFKWRHYLRRHERIHHNPCEAPHQVPDIKPTLGCVYSVATSAGCQLDASVGQQLCLPVVSQAATALSGELHLGGSDGSAQ
ncbi:hypothetical protein LSAT2_000418 [Lamellibrachia satsuma]|nr:hypothetical protein LSAT2_000418 [Lamellibrachia satsuma]